MNDISKLKLALECLDANQPEMARAVISELIDSQTTVDWEELNRLGQERQERINKLIPKLFAA